MCITPPGSIFHGRYLHSSWNGATGAKKKRSALEKSRREQAFRTHIPGIYRSVLALLAPSLVVEQRCVENRPPVGCDIHRRTWYYSLSFQATAFRAGRINLLIRDKRVIRSRPFTPAESTYKSMSLAWHSILLIAPSSDHCHTQVWARQQLPRTRSSGTYQKMDSHPVPSRGI